MTDGVATDSAGDVFHPEVHKIQRGCTRSLCQRLCVAEEVACAVVERILIEGGHLLWQHHLARKAFAFAADASLEAAVSNTQMRCVPHDSGEDSDILDNEDWSLEPEPATCERDSWMRMMLPSTRPTQGNPLLSTSSSLGGSGRRRRRNTNQQKRQSIQRPKKERHEGPRSWSLEEKCKIPADEERVREVKAQDDAKKREQERQKKEKAKIEELERARLAELHAEMAQRPHTFDLNGNVLWVEQVNYSKLPNLQEAVSHRVLKNRSTKEAVAAAKTLNVENQTLQKPKRNPKRSPKKKIDEEFPDGFTRLNHAQPPILETMVMSSGVTLNHKGKSKNGNSAELASGKMTRQEYLMMAQREVSGNTQIEFTSSGGVRAFGGNSGSPRDASPNSPLGAKGHSTDSPTNLQAGYPATGPSQTAFGETLPAIKQGRPPPAAQPNAPPVGTSGALLKGTGAAPIPSQHSQTLERQKESKVQAAAPPMHLRARKFDSVGHLGRPPRLHMPSMGKLDVFNSLSQAPPLGATMGHGLIRHSLEEYYFPPLVPESPTSGNMVSRSKSDSALPREKHVSTRPGDESPSNDGRILPEGRSPAYRNIRKQLFPSDGPDGQLS